MAGEFGDGHMKMKMRRFVRNFLWLNLAVSGAAIYLWFSEPSWTRWIYIGLIINAVLSSLFMWLPERRQREREVADLFS